MNKKHLLIVCVLALAGVLACIWLDLEFVASIFLLYIIPAGYLSWRRPKIIAKSLTFTLIGAIPMAIVVNYLAQRDFSWYVPNSVWGFWGVAWVYLVVVFWEFFMEKEKVKNKISWNIKYLLGLMAFLQVVFWGLYIWAREVLYIPYLYLVWGMFFCLVPTVIVMYFNRKLIPKVAVMGLWFLIHSLMVEFVALTSGYWYFAGAHYVGVVDFLGHRLPYEEIVFWIILGAPGVVAWYELFADDRK